MYFTIISGNIRVVVDDAGKPWYCLKDVCAALETRRVYISLIPKKADLMSMPVEEGNPVCVKCVSYDGLVAVVEHVCDKEPENNTARSFQQFLPEHCREVEKDNPSFVMRPFYGHYNEVFAQMAEQAERAVIGTLIAHPEYYDFESLGRLYGKTLFQTGGYQYLYDRISEMYDAFHVVNAPMLKAFLASKQAKGEYIPVMEDAVDALASQSVTRSPNLYLFISFLLVNKAFMDFSCGFGDVYEALDETMGVSELLGLIDKGSEKIRDVRCFLMPFEQYIRTTDKLTDEEKQEVFLGDLYDSYIWSVENVLDTGKDVKSMNLPSWPKRACY